ncbi:DUF6884 domain-containing protein, partial [Staphylococcus aureus]|uniref:DUF6884 domain-containing protein n=1 Tax=Staphylococcus aureus TaxID=1280 RepID=UPI0039BEB991
VKVALVACCSKKLDHPAAAEDLYRSPLFRLSAAQAKRFGNWAILSAKHGLVMPKRVLAPYDTALSDMSPRERAAWAERTRSQIVAAWPAAEFVVFAGALYRTALEGLDYSDPLAGLGIGRRLKALKSWTG